MAKIDTLFMSKTAEKPYPLGPHIPIEPILESTPPPGVTKRTIKYEKIIFTLAEKTELNGLRSIGSGKSIQSKPQSNPIKTGFSCAFSQFIQ